MHSTQLKVFHSALNEHTASQGMLCLAFETCHIPRCDPKNLQDRPTQNVIPVVGAGQKRWRYRSLTPTFIWKVFEGIRQKALVQAWYTIPLQDVLQSLACS